MDNLEATPKLSVASVFELSIPNFSAILDAYVTGTEGNNIYNL